MSNDNGYTKVVNVDALGLDTAAPSTAPIVNPDATAQADTAATVTQIVFIEGNVSDLQDLLSGLSPNATAVVLDPGQDGVHQMAAYLASHSIQNLAGIDIVAHGADGAVQLGAATLDSATIAGYQAQLQQIGAALAPGGAIQLFGCDVAQDATGVSFLDQLSQATGGATIAASSHLVGDASGGGSFNLDVNTGAVSIGTPFTAAAMAGYQGELSMLSSPQLYTTDSDDSFGSDTSTQIQQSDIAAGGTTFAGSTDLADSGSGSWFSLQGVAVDPARGAYFFSALDQSGATEILTGTTLGDTGATSSIYTTGDSNSIVVNGIALDQANDQLYFAQAGLVGGTTPDASETGIFTISETGGTATQVINDVSTTNGTLVSPNDLVLDTGTQFGVANNLVFFTDSDGSAAFAGGVNNINVGNVLTGDWTTLYSFSGGAAGGIDPAVAVNPTSATGGDLYFTAMNSGDSAENYILKASYTLTGSDSTQSATIGSVTTLYAGADAGNPTSIVLNPATDTFYVTDYNGGVYAGSMDGGGALTLVGTTAGPSHSNEMSFESVPTITVGGTVAYTLGGSAISLDSGAVVSNTDGLELVNATIAITGGFSSGDTLSAGALGDLAQSYDPGTGILTLTGTVSADALQTALDSITFSTTSGDTSQRTISWSTGDGYVASDIATSMVSVASDIDLTAGGTVAYTGGGTPVTLDASATATDSIDITGATVWINSGFVTGDILNFSDMLGITGNYDTATGTLTLSGNATDADYQAALEMITYSFPANGDPTDAGNTPARGISWSVTDGSGTSTTQSSTVIGQEAPILAYGTAIDEAGIVAASETVAAGTMTLFDAGGTLVGTLAVGSTLTTSDFLLSSDGSSGTDVIVATALGTYSSGLTLLTNPTSIAVTGDISDGSGTAVDGPSGTNWMLANSGTVSETGFFGSAVSFASAGTLVNAGSISAIYGTGVSFQAGGSVTNQSGGVINGAQEGVAISHGVGSVVNAGSISSSAGDGVELFSGGAVTNQSGGTISGDDGVHGISAIYVVNAGIIAGQAVGVYLSIGGTVTNQSGGTISGYSGIEGLGAAVTVVNAGLIAGNYSNGTDDGIYLDAGGSVTNQSGGTISGNRNGVRISGAAGTVVNLGKIHAHDASPGGAGVYLANGGTVVNGASGGTVSTAYIVGYQYGVNFGASAAGTLTNFGTVSGNPHNPAVVMDSGVVINGPSGATGALIEGGAPNSALLISGAGTVINYGTIKGTENFGDSNVYYGIRLGGPGSISNLGSSALITNYVAVYATSNDTVTNAGTIASRYGGLDGAHALVFGGGTNRLIIDPGAVFIGTVSGSGPVTLSPNGNTQVIGTQNGVGTTTLELASGSSAGTLNGLGSQYVGFAAVTVDTGAVWSLAGSNTLANGVTLTDSGTLTVSGSLLNDGVITGTSQGIVLGAGGRLTNQSDGLIAGSSGGVAGSGAGTLVNAGYIGSNSGDAVSFAVGGVVTNQSGGTISGNDGVSITGASGTVDNAGAIIGNSASSSGIVLNHGGAVTNQSGGVISAQEGVFIGNGAGTVINAGSIYGGTSNGVEVADGGGVTNQSGGLISGNDAVYGDDVISVVNAGSIAGQAMGVYLRNGGTVTNLAGGAISGGSHAVQFGAGYANRLVIQPGATFSGLVGGGNSLGASPVSTLELASASGAGTLSGLGSQYVAFAQVTIDAGATWTLSGSQYGFSTLANAGTLLNGLYLATGSFAVSNQSTGTISGGLYAAGSATVTNAGSIDGGTGAGISILSSGVVTNASGGLTSGDSGIAVQSGTVVNYGSINATNSGVVLASGGSVTNAAGGTIVARYDVLVQSGSATVVNAGVLGNAGSAGIELEGGGGVTNQSGGTIAGYDGVYIFGAAGTVVNSGSIGATGSYGVDLVSGGSLTNQSGGRITGPIGVKLSSSGAIVLNAGYIGGSGTDGIDISHGGTVTNQWGGTIAGTVDAVYFAAGSTNQLVVDPGATFIGTVDGGNAPGADQISTLELASNDFAGTLSGLGTQFINFAQVTIDSGAQWTLAGSSTLASGVTLSNGGTLTASGTLLNAGTITGNTLDLAGAALTNQSSGLISGNVYGLYGGGTDSVVNFGSIGDGTTGTAIYLQDAGSVTNEAGAQITGYNNGVKVRGIGATVTNYGSIASTTSDDISYGVYLRNGGMVTNGQSGGGTSTAIIQGYDGVFFRSVETSGATGTLANYGTILGTDSQGLAVDLASGGTVVNGQSGATAALIQGSRYGVVADSGDGSVVNYASIIATGLQSGDYGVALEGSGSVTNLGANALIEGRGGVLVGQDGTVTNAGTIASNQGSLGTAVHFNGGNVRLIDDPGAVFTGSIYGGSSGTATFELASGSSAGVVTGFGTGITNFDTLVFDPGAQWTVEGVSASGLGALTIQGFGAGDTIDLTGFTAVSGTFSSNELVLSDGVVGFETLDIQGAFSTSDFNIQTVGGNTEVSLQDVPYIVAGGTATFLGGGSPIVLDGSLTVTEQAGAMLVSATIDINSGFLAGDVLNFSNTPSITGSYDAASGVLTLTGADTLAGYQAALDSITYSFNPGTTDPTNGGSDTSRTITWLANDGTSFSNPATSTLAVVHTGPTIMAGATAAFSGGGSAVVLDGSLTVTDADSGDMLAGATIAIVNDFTTGDVLNFTNAGGITGSYDPTTGTLVLSGSASVAAYQAALQSVTYSFFPSDGDPTGGGEDTSRTIRWTVDDGVATGTGCSVLTDTYVAPSVTVSGTVAFEAGGSLAATLAPDLTVSDPDSSGVLIGATITIGGFVTGDVLNFTNTGSITGNFDSETGTLVLSGTDSLADYQSALESVSFSSSTTSAGTRTISWTVNDSLASSSSGSSTVDVTYDLPTISGAVEAQATTDEAAISPFGSIAVGDLNIGQTETVTITLSDPTDGTLSNLAGGTFNNGTYVVSGTTLAVTQAVDGLLFTPTAHSVVPGATITTTFTLQVTDSIGASASDSTTSVIATAVNDPPTITQASVNAGVPNTGTATATTPFSTLTVTDPDLGHVDTVTVMMGAPGDGTFSNLSEGGYDPSTGIYTFTGNPSEVNAALAALTFTAATLAAGDNVATTNFSVEVTGPGGTASDDTISVSTVAESVPGVGSGSSAISVSSDGSSFAAPTDGQTNEAIVSGPTNGGTYALPTGYQVIYLGGTTDATLTDNSIGGAVLVGNGGNDTVSAGADGDTLTGGIGANTFIASGTNDIIGVTGTSTVQTSGSNDVVYANENPLTLTDSGSNDAIGLGSGSASLTLTGTSASVFANTGSVDLTDSGIGDAIGASTGTLTATLSGSGTRVYGSTGEMSVTVSNTASNVAIGMGSGDATITVAGDGATLFGGSGSLVATVTGHDDLIGLDVGSASLTLSGTDTYVFGGSGNLTVLDQGVGDVIGAGTGSTTVTANGQDLIVAGGGGTLDVIAGAGNDTISGGSGMTTVTGGSGSTALYGNAGGTLTFIGGTGSTVYQAQEGTETFDGSAATANLVLNGGVDASGHDTLIGGSGNDNLYVGTGSDTLTGGGGQNEFVFYKSVIAGTAPTDVVTDFNANDTVYLAGYGASEAASAVAHATSSGGSTTLTLSDNTHITFQNVASASALTGHVVSF